MQNQGWRLHVLCVLQRRAVPIQIHLLKNVAAEIGRVAVSAITRAIVGNEIRNTAQRDCGLEAIGVTDNPVSHIAAVAAAGYAHSLLIDPRISFQRHIDSVHDVDEVFAAPFADYSALKLLAITRRAPGIRKQDRVTFRGINLKLVIPIDAVLSRRSAVNAENQRILASVSPADRFDEEPIDVPVVRALVSESFDISQL